MIAIIISLSGYLITFGGGWILGAFLGLAAMITVEVIGMLAFPVGLVLACMSRSKPAIAVSIISIIVGGSIYIYWNFIF